MPYYKGIIGNRVEFLWGIIIRGLTIRSITSRKEVRVSMERFIKKASKLLLMLCVLSLMILNISSTAFASTNKKIGDFTVIGGVLNVDYIYDSPNRQLTILKDTPLTISGYTIDDKIVVKKDFSANLTFSDLYIRSYVSSPFTIEDNSTGNVNLTLLGDNTFYSVNFHPGLRKNGDASNVGTLTIGGTGSLYVKGGFRCAGIGGSENGSCKNINIIGGTITAIAGDSAAGIGGGFQGSLSNVNISGGIIKASSGGNGAGIGGGYMGNGSEVTISGGVVTAVTSSRWAEGIGGGIGGSGGGITIKETAIVFASSVFQHTRRIGGMIFEGENGVLYGDITLARDLEIPNGKTLNIPVGKKLTIPNNIVLSNNGNINVDGELYGKVHGNPPTGIGFYDKQIDLSNGSIEFYADGYTIGGGSEIPSTGTYTIIQSNNSTPTSNTIKVKTGVSVDITLDSVNILNNYASPFLIEDNSTGTVNITLSGNNILHSGSYAGLQKNGPNNSGGVLTIGGTGYLSAIGGYGSAGIGGGHMNSSGIANGDSSSSNIVITSGTVNATGGQYGAGIGGGLYGIINNIVIKGGTVNTTGGEFSAGIGGGYMSDSSFSNIIISGGKVNSIGGLNAAGIGDGVAGKGSNININGGIVSATGGKWGTGIGGINGKSGFNIVIDGNAVVFTSSIYLGASRQGGMLFIGNTGELYGDVILFNDLQIPSDKTLTIPSGKRLTISDSVVLTNNGSIINNGEILGKISGNPSSSDGIILGEIDLADGSVVIYSDGYTVGGSNKILYTGAYTITQTNNNISTVNTIRVQVGVSASISLDGVNIDVSEKFDTCAFLIENDSEVNINLPGNNSLKSGSNYAGVQLNGDSSTLTIDGTGSLNAIGNNEPGLRGSNIIINGGTVVVNGGNGRAGIQGNEITISGGNVTANGGGSALIRGNGGAGIQGSEITISGGNVTANGGFPPTAGNGGTGIQGGDLIISGGTVSATAGGRSGNGINAKSFVISGGTITANSGIFASYIGGCNVKIIPVENSKIEVKIGWARDYLNAIAGSPFTSETLLTINNQNHDQFFYSNAIAGSNLGGSNPNPGGSNPGEIDECFIATAAYGSKYQQPVVILRQFRDKFLLTNELGTKFVEFYYKNSPPIARTIAGNWFLNTLVRVLLIPLVLIVIALFYPTESVLIIGIIILGWRMKKMTFKNGRIKQC